MSKKSPVLVTWVAVNNDPYERIPKTGDYILDKGDSVPGPTLNLLFDPQSEYCDKIRDVVFFHRLSGSGDDSREKRAISETCAELRTRDSTFNVLIRPWKGTDPTDHLSLFEFLRAEFPELRRKFAGRELVIHVSPGTPSMQTVLVLMAETGMIAPPFRVVKSYRANERHGRPPVVPVEIGIDTFYKAYHTSRPGQVGSEEQRVEVDPVRFRTDRMRKLYSEARRFAQVKVPVLILGERGTGKSTLATWIRLHSPYRKHELDSKWPAVACGQYNAETMRAELFGYLKGAFTGANSDKAGLLAAADGDTLFLDEIGDVSKDLQRLLIKAIEERGYYPLGSDQPRKSEFRLLCATNLEPAALDKRLDPDFRDRVNALTLTVPPLRDIPDELDLLWESVYRAAVERAGATQRQAHLADTHHQRVVARLRQHPLPGNMRDLFRVAYRIVAARADVHEPLAPADAAEYALAALADVTVPLEGNPSRQIARAFADSLPLDEVVSRVGRVRTADLVRDLRSFVGSEIRRISKSTGQPLDQLSDVTERTLREWANETGLGKKLPIAGEKLPKADR